MLTGEAEIRGLLDGALKASGAAQTEGVLDAGREAVTRFACNRIHQNVFVENAGFSFRAADGKRVGGARSNGLDAKRMAECAARAAAIARVQAEDPEFPGLVASPRAEDASARSYDDATANMDSNARAKMVLPAIERARKEGLEASGALTVWSDETAIANSLGTFQYHRSTAATLHVVARKGSVEGAWTETAVRAGDIDPERAAERAVRKCLSGRDPVAVDPGEWTVVLEDEAVADMVDMLSWMGFGGLAFVEGRSFLCGKVGERIVSDSITLADDPFAAAGRVRPFDFEGVPKKRVVLIDRGVARGPVHDTRTAAKAGAASTGHALPEPNTRGPFPLNLALDPGTATLDEMIRSTKRGLLVSRFHYTNPVDPRRTVITGMTRFGTWLIEGGRIVRPVRSMRFTDSVLAALSRVEAVGKDIRRVGDTMVPALKLASWRFVGVTGE